MITGRGSFQNIASSAEYPRTIRERMQEAEYAYLLAHSEAVLVTPWHKIVKLLLLLFC